MKRIKTSVRGLRQPQNSIQYYCKDCEHHYDEHSKALDGHLILCRCPFKMDGGKFCVFMTDRACELFKLRSDYAKT